MRLALLDGRRQAVTACLQQQLAGELEGRLVLEPHPLLAVLAGLRMHGDDTSGRLDEFLAEMYTGRKTSDTSGRALRMVAGYFEDMARVLANLQLSLRPGAGAAITVGTQAFNGEVVPTDLLLAAIGEEVGLTSKAVWVARAKGVAAQQRRYKPGGTRECVLLLSN